MNVVKDPVVELLPPEGVEILIEGYMAVLA